MIFPNSLAGVQTAIVAIAVITTAPALADSSQTLWHVSNVLVNANDPPIMSPAACLVMAEPPCGEARSDFGSAVAYEGGMAIVGSPHAGRVHFYERSSPDWPEVAVFEGPEGLGQSVAMSGDLAVALAPAAGSIHVYDHDATGWRLNATLTLPGPCGAGHADIAGHRIAVALPCLRVVSIHEWDGTQWTRTVLQDLPASMQFAGRVALTETSLFLGLSDGIHELRPDSGWAPQHIVKQSVGRFAATDDTIAFAAAGALKVHARTPDGWVMTASVAVADVSPFDASDGFGVSLAMTETMIVVGADQDDPLPAGPSPGPLAEPACAFLVTSEKCVPPTPGAAYVFELLDGMWQQTAKLVGGPAGEDAFGAAVALDAHADTLLVGAPGKLAHNVALVHVDPMDTVHVFARGSV